MLASPYSRSRSLVSVLAVATIATLAPSTTGCAGDVEPGGSGGAGGQSGQGGDTMMKDGGFAGAGGSDAPLADGGPLTCTRTEASASPIEFVFKNNGKTMVRLRGAGDCGDEPAFTLARCGSAAVPFRSSCSQCFCNRCDGRCPDACPDCEPDPSGLVVAAGASHPWTWNGTVLVTRVQTCGMQSHCVTAEPAPHGTWTLTMSVDDGKDSAPRTVTREFALPLPGGVLEIEVGI